MAEDTIAAGAEPIVIVGMAIEAPGGIGESTSTEAVICQRGS
jgi:hypothetical protein